MNDFRALNSPDQSIICLGLSRRAENALLRNGIYTIYDLQNLTAEDIFNLRGVGVTCANEIIRLGFLGGNTPSVEKTDLPTITEYMERIGLKKETTMRNYRMFVRYFNNYPDSTYDELADRENITRSRAGQIITKTLQQIASLVRKRQVSGDFVQLAIEYAKNTTRTDAVVMNSDSMLNGVALAIIASEVIPEQVAIYSNPRYLNHRWVVSNKDQVNASFESLMDFLSESYTKHSIDELSASFQLNKALILDAKNISAENGTITLKGNRIARGDSGEDIVERYLEEANGPAYLSDIAKNTGKTLNQIRSYIGRMNSIKNVGQSVYVLKDEKFESQSVVELVRKYLMAVKRPAMISKVVEYVQEYRDIPEESIRYVLFNSNSIFEKRHGYMRIWIKGMPYKKSDDSRNYDIQIDNAVLWIFKNTDDPLNKEAVQNHIKATFGDKTTHNMVSVYSAIRRLTDKELLRRVGDYNSGLYMKSRDFDNQISNDHQIKTDFLYFENNLPYREKEDDKQNDATPAVIPSAPDSNIPEGPEPKNKEETSRKNDFEAFLAKNVGDFISFKYKGKYEHNWNKWRNALLTRYSPKYFWCEDVANNRDVAYCRDKVLDFRSFYDSNNEKLTNLGGLKKVFEQNPTRKDNTKTPSLNELTKGKSYKNTDLQRIFLVSGQGGMRKSNRTNCLVLISKHNSDNPYDDKWNGDHFEYTGMGMNGNQSVNYMQNKTLAESNTNGVTVHLFESFANNDYIYRGIVTLDGKPYYETQEDESGEQRKVVKFSLKLIS